MRDSYSRKLNYLRLSITDKCNLRCRYCMPAEGVQHLCHEEILSFEEIERLCGIMASLGVNKIRVTGGEPLVRKDAIRLIGQLKKISGIKYVGLTTNGTLLKEKAKELTETGIDGVNISIDTLDRKTYAALTGSDMLMNVTEGMKLLLRAGVKVKVNCVPIKGINDDGLSEVAFLARDENMDVRFIELMPIGEGSKYTGISQSDVLERLEKRFGAGHPEGDIRLLRSGGETSSKADEVIAGRSGKERSAGSDIKIQPDRGTKAVPDSDSAAGSGDDSASGAGDDRGPAVYYRFDGFKGRIGFISPISDSFCSECNRLRLTQEGYLKLCLYHNEGVDLKKPLREGATDDEIRNLILSAVERKPKGHSFFGDNDDTDKRRMYEIGG